jgi:5'-nucleotidase
MLAARPDAQIALGNGGGLRADLPAGELTYGQLFEAMPFDNRFAILDVTGKQVRRLVASNLRGTGGIFSWGGLTATARCKDGKLDVKVKIHGKPLDEQRTYQIVTSDFLASGGDGVMKTLALPPTAIHATEVIIRDAMADALRKVKAIDPKTLSTPKRLDYEGARPVSCGKPEEEP